MPSEIPANPDPDVPRGIAPEPDSADKAASDQETPNVPQDSVATNDRSNDAAAQSKSSADMGVEQAQTVIRGSSRRGTADESMRQTPAVVAKVLHGQHLNQYRIDDLIGGGGMGAVFRAHDDQLDRTVAIKVIPFVGDDPELKRRFRNEAQSAAKLDHPGIARVYDIGNHDQWHYIVFEYIEGTNIRDLITSHGVFTIDDAVFHTCQLAEAIQHAADRGIVHRDIKPSNVIVREDGSLKLVDMGLARSEHVELSEDMTASGVTLGTFDYISPEQARDPRNADVRSDIYSLGCTLYFMLTGNPPYPGGTMAQKIISHETAPPPNVQQLRPAVSNHLTAVLNKMLAKSPDQRYANANDLLADLREVARRDNLGRTFRLAPKSAASPTVTPPWLKRYSPWLAALALVWLIAGWMQLTSRTDRFEVTPPASATPLSSVSVGNRGGQQPIDSAAVARTDNLFKRTDGEESNISADTKNASALQDTSGSAASPTADDPRSRPDPPAFPSDPTSSPPVDPPSAIRIVPQSLGSGNVRDAAGVALVNTLADAVAMAEQFEIGLIEISTPVLYCDPIRINGTQPLIIRSTIGGSRIVMRAEDRLGDNRISLIALRSEQMEFQDLHFYWEVPRRNLQGGDIFDIQGDRQLRLDRCSLTVNNVDDNDNIYVFNTSADSSLFGYDSFAALASRLQTTAIELRDCVIRGGCSLVAHDGRTYLRVDWNNGLLAIDGRMIDATGSRSPQAFDRRSSIELNLNRLTAHPAGGFARIERSRRNSRPLTIERQALGCLFLVGTGAPYFEYRGLDQLEVSSDLIRLRGAANGYISNRWGTDPILRVETNTQQSEVTTIIETRANSPSWFQDSSPQWLTYPWENAPVQSIDAAKRTVNAYQQSLSEAGFDPESLPLVPAASSETSSISEASSNASD